MQTILFPSSYFSDSKVDEDLEKEYNAVMETGLFSVILFSYDKWFSEGILKLNQIPDEPLDAVYRGWMMKPEMYEAFYQKLKKNNIRLITSPKEYELFHIFPNIYPQLENDTAKMIVFNDGNVSLDEVRKHFSRFMVKDFVKSVKGTSFPVYFENTISSKEFEEHMQTFYKYRGGLRTGGICIKEYLTLKRYGGHTNEYRVFCINGNPVSVSRNSGQPVHSPTPPAELISKYSNLGSPYYTVDFAELENGEWKILEAGDGQVSGLSDFQDYNAYFRALYHSLN